MELALLIQMSSRDFTERSVVSPSIASMSEEECPDCGASLRRLERETYCPDCGLVVSTDLLDRGPDWRWSEDGTPERKRTGAPLTAMRHDLGLSAEIGRDPVGNDGTRRQLSRLRREHNRAKYRSKAERNLAAAFVEIARLTSALDLSRSVRERASTIFREAQRERLLVGRSIEALAAGSVYAACRCTNVALGTDELTSVARCPRRHIEWSYRLLNRELRLATPPSRPQDYVPKLATAMNAPDAVRILALDLATRAESAGIANGCHPGGVAAACVYRAGHELGQLYTQTELAAIVDINPATIRSRLQDLEEHHD